MKDTEYTVNEFDEHGDIVDQRCYPTLIEALADFNTTVGHCEIERWRSVWNDDDGNLEDRKYKTIKQK